MPCLSNKGLFCALSLSRFVRPNLDAPMPLPSPNPDARPDSTGVESIDERALYEQGFAQFADDLGDFIGQLKRWSREDTALPRTKAGTETLSLLTLDLVRWLTEMSDHRPELVAPVAEG